MLERPSLEKFVGARINSYVVEQLIEQSELGALFSARDTSRGTQYVLGILSISLGAETAGRPSVSSASQTSSLVDTLANQANTIALLQHPYILPLVAYGSVGDLPYLVWPAIPTRPLGSRLVQGGWLDMLTVGRYLDQIAAALEYAHEHLVLHRSLTVDALSLQRDGRILVHDFGIRRMLEQGRKDAEWYSLRNWNEACAPEQILGLAASPATDVYAMGIILYQLLTGEPPYTGARRKDIMQQHLQVPIPSIKTRRPDLPSELDYVLAAATAKQAPDRLSQPGALANAYYDVVSPQQSGRVPFKINTGSVINTTPSSSKSGHEAVLSQGLYSNPGYAPPEDQPGLLPTLPRYRSPHLEAAAPLRRSQGFSPLRTLLIAGLLIALILGTFLTVTRLESSAAAVPIGQVSFMDSSAEALGQTNALAIQATGLPLPPSGSAYYAWMINQQTERVLALGPLAQHGQTYSLSYQSIGATSGTPGTNLLTLGTLMEITLEQGNALLPTGKVVMSGIFPPESFVHVGHLLISFPTTPGKIGLLVGAETETQLLLAQAQALKAAGAENNVAAIQCEAQSILDIIQGSVGPQYRALPATCAAQHIVATGDGFGLLGIESATYHTLTGYLTTAAEHAGYAASEPDATANLRTHAHYLELAIENVQGWVTTIEQDALLLQQAPLNGATIPAIATLAGEAWYGIDGTGNQQTSTAISKAGMVTAFTEGQQMATLTLVSKG